MLGLIRLWLAEEMLGENNFLLVKAFVVAIHSIWAIHRDLWSNPTCTAAYQRANSTELAHG